MSHSVVKDFPTETNNTLVLVVNQNGEVSVDQQTLDSFIKLGNTDVSILRVDNDDGTTVDMTLDTFHQSDTMEELTISVEEENIRNYNSFRMDHCYTPLTSPSQKLPVLDQIDNELLLDDLAQTLSLLDGSNKPSEQVTPEKLLPPPLPSPSPAPKEQKPNDKVTVLLNKVNKLGVHKVYKSVKAKVVKAEDEDDLNDADFELNESPVKIKQETKRSYRRRLNEISNDARKKIVKVRKGIKHIVYKPQSQPQKIILEPAPPAPTAPQSSQPVKPSEVKKPPKKEKKPPKPIDDGIALFSTPDIIRRVGKSGEKLPDIPESPPKPARVDSGRMSTETKQKPRTSLDSKPKELERRGSTASDKSVVEHVEAGQSDQNESTCFNPIDLENASAEMIRSIIHTDETPTIPIPPQPPVPLAPVDQTPLNLEGTGLDIDQGVLDNINTDELIPEDILYQVAKLVENPDVQNVIDRTLVDSGLNLNPTRIIEQPAVPQLAQVAPIIQPTSQEVETSPRPTQRPVQIVRSDGRVVTLPPIEKPATRSSKKKQEPPQSQPNTLQPQQQPQPQQHLHHPKPNVHPGSHHKNLNIARSSSKNEADDDGASQGDTDSDVSWNSEDDPDRLWCICKQPHNNRFMICCDTCEDWFHGKCVNVTKAMGQLMEQQGKEWMCPNCTKKANPTATQNVPQVSPLATKPPAKISNESQKRKSSDSSPACIVCGNLSRANSVYCSDACILKHAQGVEKESSKATKGLPDKIIVFERTTGKCLSGPNAPNSAHLKQWLRDHPSFELVGPTKKQNLIQSKLQLLKNPNGREGVGVAVNKKGVQIGILPHTSKHQGFIKLIPATKMNITGVKTQSPKESPSTSKKKLIQTTLKSPPHTTPIKPKPSTPKQEKTRERKQKLQVTQESPKQNAQENIRDTVKKTLNEQLLARLKDSEDLKLTDSEIDKMATEIELQLYKLFGDSGPKYRTKYRSLIFNIKDIKNQTLWRRICEKTIAPAQLVRLSPEEMASQELARWREREIKHQLDMIKKSELEMLTINRTYVLKTHKGEQVMEDRPSVKVDSTEIIPGLGADSTSEHDSSTVIDKTDMTEYNYEKRGSKHGKRDRDKDRHSSKDRSSSKDRHSKDHSSSRNDRRSRRSRSHDRDRSSHRSERKRSRSRDRHHRSSHKSSRHKRDKHSNNEHLDKKSREILDNLENNKIVPPLEDRLWKHVPQQDVQVTTPDSDSDHEPTSTVTIPTPPRSTEQEESQSHITKQPEVIISTNKPEPKSEPATKPLRTDPRLNREVSVETPKTEENSPPPLSLSESSSPTPPSQVKFTSESKEAIIWEGNINMVDVAKFFITLHEVSGDCVALGSELPTTLEIVGRISPDTVWDYIGKMRRSNSKLISILRLTAGNMEEKMPYIALYSYLSSRNRLGVIKCTNNSVKDFYILPLASHAPVPQALLPLSGPGFEESRPHLLLGILVRAKRKRPSTMDIISSGSAAIKRSRIENSPIVLQPSTTATPTRSYTPPPTRPDPRIRLPTVPATNDEDEPYSPEDSDPEGTIVNVNNRNKIVTKSTEDENVESKTDITTVLTSVKTTTYLEQTQTVASFEPFANKFETIPGLDVDTGVDSLQRKMAELDKCIEKQKEEIRSISQDIVSSGAAASMSTNLSNISLPSNLQQILDSIKKIPPVSSSPGSKNEEYKPTATNYKKASVALSEELTIPLLLPKLNSRSQSMAKTLPTDSPSVPPLTIPLQLPVTPRDTTTASESITLPNLSLPPIVLPNTNIPPPVVLPNLCVPPPKMSSIPTIPLNLPKPKMKPAAPQTPAASESKPVSVLSSLSEEELIRKAAEMLGETETSQDEVPEIKEDVEKLSTTTTFKSPPVMYSTTHSAPNPPKRTKIDTTQPPIPGLEDEY